MTDLDTASAHHTDASRGCPSLQSARGAGFTRCARPAQQQAAARTIQRSIDVPPAPTEPCPRTPPAAPEVLANVKRRAVPQRATSAAIVALIAAGTTVAFLRWPRLVDSITPAIRGLNGVWVVPAIALAGVSMLTAALQQRRVLRAAGLSLPVRSMVAITLAGNAVSVTLPLAGSTAGTAFTYLQLKRRGADVAAATWTLAMCGIISTAVLAVVLGVGAGVTGDGATSAVGAVAVLLGIVPIGVLLISFRSPMVRGHAERIVERVIGRLHRTKHGAGDLNPVVVSRAFERMAWFRIGWRAGATASVYSAVNWVTDLACLAVCVSALGVPVPWAHLVIVYGATLGAATLSFTPAGIGIVESAIAVALVQGGVPTSAAIVAALLYRAVSCWLALGVGWISYAMMRRSNFVCVDPSIRRSGDTDSSSVLSMSRGSLCW